MFGELGVLTEGSRIAFVGQVESWNERGSILRCLGSDTRVVVGFNITCGIWTLYDYVVVGKVDGLTELQGDKSSRAFPEPNLNAASFKHAVELCCGIGGISVGAVRLGWKTKVFVDQSPLACKAVECNHGYVLCGKVEDPQIQKQVHEAVQGVRPVILAGFPCQPYSVLGSGKGLMDQRGQTLKSILRIAWLSRASAVVLECVSEVAQYKDTMDLLQHFAGVMHFQFHAVTLELAEQWPARRRRWWCAMLPQGHSFELCNWSKDSRYTSISDVLPEWPSWSMAEEQDLQWSEEEKDKYSDPLYGSEARRLDMQGVMPTALHSWGSALRSCPCGCRQRPFAEERLRSHGLRGFGVWSDVIQDIRFAHPKEVGYLNTLPMSLALPDPPRAALCLVGQLAAPMQSLWVLAQVHSWVQTVYEGASATVPACCLEELKRELLSSRIGSAQPAVSGMPCTPPLGVPSPEPLCTPVSMAAASASPEPLGVLSPEPSLPVGRSNTGGQVAIHLPLRFSSPGVTPCITSPASPSFVGVLSPEPPAHAHEVSNAGQGQTIQRMRKVSLRTQESRSQIRLSATTTVAELCQAESKLHGPGVKVKVRQHSQDLQDTHVLEIFNEVDYEVVVRPKKQARSVNGLQVLVLTAAGLEVCTGQVGDSVGEALTRAGLQPAEPFLDLATQCSVSAAHILRKSLAIDARPVLSTPQEGMPDTFVWVALRRLCVLSQQNNVRILPPSVATLLLECHPSALPRCQDPLGPSVAGTKLLIVFAQDNHWSLLVLEVLPSHKVQAQLFDGIPGRNTLAAEKLALRIGQVWDKLVLQVEEIFWFPQVEAHCCGAIALLHASRHLLGHTVPACQLVSELEEISRLGNLLPRAWASGGLSAEQEQAFTAILLEHGVHPQQVQERVKAAVSKVGDRLPRPLPTATPGPLSRWLRLSRGLHLSTSLPRNWRPRSSSVPHSVSALPSRPAKPKNKVSQPRRCQPPCMWTLLISS